MKLKPRFFNYEEELNKSYFKSKQSYDLAIGCLNRICVTDSEEEINRMVCGLIHDIEVISSENRKRIRIKKYFKKEGKQ